jgi:hypothetical protein
VSRFTHYRLPSNKDVFPRSLSCIKRHCNMGERLYVTARESGVRVGIKCEISYNASMCSFHSARCATLRTDLDRQVLSPSFTIVKNRLSFPRRVPRWGRLHALRTRRRKTLGGHPGRRNEETYRSPVIGPISVEFVLSEGDWWTVFLFEGFRDLSCSDD